MTSIPYGPVRRSTMLLRRFTASSSRRTPSSVVMAPRVDRAPRLKPSRLVPPRGGTSLEGFSRGARSTLGAMTTEEGVRRLEDAVNLLSNIVERRTGPYGIDVIPTVAREGARLHQWAESVQAERSGD